MKVNFNVAVLDAFGEEIKEGKGDKPVLINRSLVNVMMHPQALPDGKQLDGEGIVKRMLLNQKIASGKEQDYDSDEITAIRETVVNMYNKRLVNVELAGAILKITK